MLELSPCPAKQAVDKPGNYQCAFLASLLNRLVQGFVTLAVRKRMLQFVRVFAFYVFVKIPLRLHGQTSAIFIKP
jgi:hypothetical protein